MAKASLGFALIARDSQDHLEACLKSIRPYVQQIVVGVDVLSKDKTERIARKYADKVFPIEVSEWHECEAHGRIRAQHFARARNESFKHLDPALDFYAWIDSDDVIPKAALIPAVCKNLPEEAIGVWAPYEYSSVVHEDGTREVNTLFHRERILRTRYRGQPVQWDWQHRVHEVVVPVGIQNPQWIQNDELRWVHQHQAHKSENSAPRNLALLEIELEENPDDPRTVFYMGNQYFAVGEWELAADWYEQYTQRFPDGNAYERWQAYCYMSLAYERLRDVGSSLRAAFGAIDALPFHPEPYWRLAAIYAQLEQPQKAVYWSERADQCPDAPFFAFKNPMDRSFNKLLPLADAHMQMGNVSAAKRLWAEAVSVFPDERVKGQLEQAELQERAADLASSFVKMVPHLGEDGALAAYEALPEGVKAFGRTRNVAMTILRQRRSKSTQPRIAFFCGKALEPWAPPTLNGSGIGGSETAVIEIARRFQAAGWQADVYGWADYMEGEYDGVGYWDAERYKPEAVDVFVGWRRPDAYTLAPDAKQKVLWCHDLNYGPDPAKNMLQWDTVLGVSGWHAELLGAYYHPLVAGYVPNGIDLSRFMESTEINHFHPGHTECPPQCNDAKAGLVPRVRKKVPWRCVYASSPDRGLLRLLSLWPSILKTEPEAELHIAYGWENTDKMIAGGRGDLQAFKDDVMRKVESTERVVWRGRLPQDEVAKLYSESWLWLYPTDFLEVSCISAMEAMAGGAVPVTTRCGALAETISTAGLLIPGPTTSRGYQETWLNVVRGALLDASLRLEYAKKGRERAQELTWEASFQRWLQVLGVDVTHDLAEAA